MEKINVKNTTEVVKEKTRTAIQDYKKFALKGNIIDLAIGVVIGAAFTNIINSIVSNLITPLLGVLTNKVDISALYVSLTEGSYTNIEEARSSGALIIGYGAVLNSLLNFLIVSIILFLIVKILFKKHEKTEKVEEVIRKCDFCKSKIDLEATRCPHCTSMLQETNV